MKSQYLCNALLDHVLGCTEYTPPTNIYAALFTALPNDSLLVGTEPSLDYWTNYTRVGPIVNNSGTGNTWSLAPSGVKTNQIAFNFGTAAMAGGIDTANNPVIVGVGIFDANPGGNVLYYGKLVTPIRVIQGQSVVISSGHFIVDET